MAKAWLGVSTVIGKHPYPTNVQEAKDACLLGLVAAFKNRGLTLDKTSIKFQEISYYNDLSVDRLLASGISLEDEIEKIKQDGKNKKD